MPITTEMRRSLKNIVATCCWVGNSTDPRNCQDAWREEVRTMASVTSLDEDGGISTPSKSSGKIYTFIVTDLISH